MTGKTNKTDTPPADTTDTPPADTATAETPPPPAAPAPDQAAIEAAVAAAIAKAEADTVAKLGMTVEEAQKLAADREAAELAAMTEAERREKAAAELEAQANARLAEANATILKANAKSALLAAGFKGNNIDRQIPGLNLAADADLEAITAAVESFKAEEPAMFGEPGTAPAAGASIPPGTAKPTKPGTAAPAPTTGQELWNEFNQHSALAPVKPESQTRSF